MIHSKYLNTFFCALLCIILSACEDDMQFNAKGNPTDISINASIGFSGEESRKILTDSEEKNISGYTLLYYTNENGKLKLYLKEYSNKLPFNVVVPYPGDEKNLAILVANAPENAFEALAEGSEISELNNVTYEWTHTNNTPEVQKFTWSGHKYVSKETIKDAQTLTFQLNPNVAKITLKIVDNTTNSQTVNLRLKRIRDKVRYAQNALYRSEQSTENELELGNRGYFSYDMEDMTLSKNSDNSYSWYVPHNEPYIAPTDNNNYSRITGTVPPGSTFIEIDDLRSDGTNLCTSYRIYPGVSEGNKDYQDLSNFNIIADYQYNITATINNDGIGIESTTNLDYVSDPIVNVTHKIKLPGNSNSYMIHPVLQKINTKTDDNGMQHEYIVWELPVHERVNEYWGGVKGDNSRTLTEDSKWQVEVIWQDINGRALYFTDEYANAQDDVYPGEGLNPIYFILNRNKLFQKEKITYTTTNDIYGNILIGLKLLDDNGNVVKFSENDPYRRDDGKNDYLWSWHLWVTDYHPDNAPANTAKTTLKSDSAKVDFQGGKYYNSGSSLVAYNNPKSPGNVYHYWHYGSTTFLNSKSEPIWTSGIYKNKWIMDRNIGAQSHLNGHAEDPIEGFGLYYQYGRKDPFPYHGSIRRVTDLNIYKKVDHYIYEIDGTNRVAEWDQRGSLYNGGVSMNIGVMNPMSYFSYTSSVGNSWTSDANTRPWFSPTTDTHVTTSNGKKTLFDPCPPGWCIPKYDAFDFMCANNGIYSNSDGTVAYPQIFYSYAHSSTGIAPTNLLRHYTEARIRINGSSAHTKMYFPYQGYISPSGNFNSVKNHDSTLQLPSFDHSLDLRGYIWCVDACTSTSYSTYGIGYGVSASGVNGRAECLLDDAGFIQTYPSSKSYGGYWLLGKRGAYKATFSTSRGQNIRCIQIPD